MAQHQGNGGVAPDLVVIIPASNESALIATCLRSVLAQDDGAGRLLVVVAANGCRDDTAAQAQALAGDFAARGWDLRVLDIAEGGKTNALNRAEAALGGAEAAAPRAYLDADVTCDPPLMGQLVAALATDAPRYATGTLAVRRADSAITRRYAAIWTRLPFVTGGAVGAGLFAVNAAGRARWGAFPDIISDDTFVRMSFTPDERIETPARYHWPMVEGLANLIRVRRRQDAGVHQIARLYPDLPRNEAKTAVTPALLARLGLRDPLGLGVYLWVHVATRLRNSGTEWSRGR